MQRTTKRATSNDSAQQPGASVATSLVLFSRIVPNKPTVPTVASRPRHIGWPLDGLAMLLRKCSDPHEEELMNFDHFVPWESVDGPSALLVEGIL